MSGGLVDNHATVAEGDTGRNTQIFGKNRGFVGLTVAIRVFDYHDLVAPFSRRLKFIGIINGATNPQAAFMVPVHGNRLTRNLVLGGKQPRLQIGRMNQMFARFCWFQRFLHPTDRFRGGT